jgi:hypothetical protein
MVIVGGLMLAKTAHAQDDNAVTGPVIGIDLGYDFLLYGLHIRNILTLLEQPTLVSVS